MTEKLLRVVGLLMEDPILAKEATTASVVGGERNLLRRWDNLVSASSGSEWSRFFVAPPREHRPRHSRDGARLGSPETAARTWEFGRPESTAGRSAIRPGTLHRQPSRRLWPAILGYCRDSSFVFSFSGCGVKAR